MKRRLGLLAFLAIMGAATGSSFATTASTITYPQNSYVGPTGTSIGSAFSITTNKVSAGCILVPSGWQQDSATIAIAGLTVDTATSDTATGVTCSITGTPTMTTNGTQTYAVKNKNTSATPAGNAYYSTSLSITITPTSLVYPQNPAVYAINAPIVANVPSINTTGDSGTISYAISSGTLPAGLSISSSTGAITGTPTAAVNDTVTIKATNSTGGAGGFTTTRLLITVQAAPNYAAYLFTRSITINTSGLGITSTQTNYPLLLRLDSTKFNFAQAKSSGADIRFSATRGGKLVDLPYQVERWDSANKVAEVWVAVDSVYSSTATNAATQAITMYFGNAAATSNSNGSLVFSPFNGYQAVYHMDGNSTTSSGTTGAMEPDVTGNNYHANAVGAGPAVSAGYIGLGRSNFTTANFLRADGSGTAPMGYGAPVPSETGALNFHMFTAYTLSAWANVGSATAGGSQYAILSKGNDDYQMQVDNGQWENTQSVYLGAASNGNFQEYTNIQNTASPVALGWHYIVGVGVNVAKDSSQLIYVDGLKAAVLASYKGAHKTRVDTFAVALGAYPGGSNNWYGTTSTGATLDEVSLSNVSRDSNWVRLNFQVQCNGNVSPSPTTCPVTSPVVVGAAVLQNQADVYSTWAHHRLIGINTQPASAGGATLPGTLTKFPLLVRLSNATTPDVFTGSLAGGLDIRFAKKDGTHVPYQRERWDAVNKLAEFWVLVDSVQPNAQQANFLIYWGKAGANDSSNSTAVFDSANGFQAVFHMNKGDTTSEKDASVNHFNASEYNQPVDTVGIIGRARYLNGTNQRFQIDSSHGSSLNFQLTDSYTLSAWFNATAVSTTANDGNKIIDKGDNQYVLADYDAASPKYWEITTRGNNAYNQCTSNSAFTETGFTGLKTIDADSTLKAWHHIFGTFQGAAVGNAIAESLYFDGKLVSSWAGTNTNNTGRVLTFNVNFGVQAAGTAPLGTTFTRYWNGFLDEMRLENRSRSAGWANLSYLSQQAANSNTVVLGATDATSVTFPVGIKNAQGQFGSSALSSGFSVLSSGSGIVFRLPEGLSAAHITVMDIWGRTVWSRNADVGARDMAWTNSKSQARGIYLVRLTANSSTGAKQVIAQAKISLMP